MKYKDGVMIHTAQPKKIHINAQIRHLELK